MRQTSIPVLYYHRVGAPDPVHLSISCRDFEKQLRYLQHAGYRTISIKELIERLTKRSKANDKVVCLTFDDGFIDNLRYAHPLLKKYGACAALFVATALIRPENQSAAESMTDFNTAHTLARLGDYSHFLSEKELQWMAADGTWEILSHSHRHNQVFTSSRLTGIYPDTDNHWGILSAYGEEGRANRLPVFTRGAGLINHAWKPIPTQDKTAVFTEVGNYTFIHESDEEYTRRVEEDLRQSLEIIRRISPQAPAVICWPWGKTSPKLERIAKQVGFIAALRTDTGANYPGMDLMKIHRFAIKKSDLLRFKLGLLLRNHRFVANCYSWLKKLTAFIG